MSEKPREHFEEEPKPEEPKRISGLMRVAGVSPETEAEILKGERTEIFNRQKKFKGEVEKTSEELRIVIEILKDLPEFIKKYKGVMPPITPDHVHIIDYDSLNSEQKERIGEHEGTYHPEVQSVSVITNQGGEDSLTFAHRTGHELMHFSSFLSATGNMEKGTLSFRVGGLDVVTNDEAQKENYFYYLNEAVTEELAERFDKEFFSSITELSEDIKIRDGKKERSIGGDGLSNIDINRLKPEAKEYLKGRIKLREIIKEIQQKNPEQFKSDEDVFTVFAEAYFTGKRLKVARLIEKTFGKGAFRKIGEETKTYKQAKKPEDKK